MSRRHTLSPPCHGAKQKQGLNDRVKEEQKEQKEQKEQEEQEKQEKQEKKEKEKEKEAEKKRRRTIKALSAVPKERAFPRGRSWDLPPV